MTIIKEQWGKVVGKCRMQWCFRRVQKWIRKISSSFTFLFSSTGRRNLTLFFRWANERTGFQTASCKFSFSFCTSGHLNNNNNKISLAGRCALRGFSASSKGKCLKIQINLLRAIWCTSALLAIVLLYGPSFCFNTCTAKSPNVSETTNLCCLS